MKNVVITPYPESIVFNNSEPKVIVYLKVGFGRSQKSDVLEIKDYETFHANCSTEKQKNKKNKETETINSFFKSGDHRERQVFMVPEDWEEGSVDKGYEMARELLNTVGAKKSFNLYFVSMFKQEQLLKMVSNENKIMVRTFPHLWLLGDAVTLKPEAYSPLHFKLIRDIAVSNKGRLAAIRHEVKNIVRKGMAVQNLPEQSQKHKNHILGILNDLDCAIYHTCYPECKEKLAEFRKRAEKVTTAASAEEMEKAADELQSDIYRLIDKIEGRLLNGEDPKKNTDKEDYRVLIIDDNPDQRKELFDFFSKHYKSVSCNDMDEILSSEEMQQWKTQMDADFPGEAFSDTVLRFTLKDTTQTLQWLDPPKKSNDDEKPYNIQKFDLVILDLLFMNQTTSIWQPLDGLDLLCSIRNNSPFSTVRIITSLPRNEISTILGKEEIDLPMNHIFTKGNGWLQLEGCLYDRLDEINLECKKNLSLKRDSENLVMPTNGEFFNKPSVWSYVLQLRKTINPDTGKSKFEEAFEEAKKLIESKGTPIPLRKNGPLTQENIPPVFVPFLAHRLAFLTWAANKCPNEVEFAVEDYAKEAKKYNVERTIDNKYFDYIGFREKRIEGIDRARLQGKDLFPEELDYFYSKIKPNATSEAERPSDLVCMWCRFSVWLEFRDNEDIHKRNSFTAFSDSLQKNKLTKKAVRSLLTECCNVASTTPSVALSLEKVFKVDWMVKTGQIDQFIVDLGQILGEDTCRAVLPYLPSR